MANSSTHNFTAAIANPINTKKYNNAANISSSLLSQP